MNKGADAPIFCLHLLTTSYIELKFSIGLLFGDSRKKGAIGPPMAGRAGRMYNVQGYRR
jgi:hypothetical protein